MIDGAQKASKIYDSLMKSGKFTALQNKKESEECLSSISELVEICEAEGFIPRFYISSPNDQVDATIEDLKSYTKSLITEERNLGDLIESAVKAMSIQESRLEDDDNEDEANEIIENPVPYLPDEAFAEFEEFKTSEDDDLLALLDEEGW